MADITADTVEVLETHAEWRAADVLAGADWTLELDRLQVAEVLAAVEFAQSVHDDLLDVTAADFPLPTLAPVIAEIENELINGRGFARVSGLPVDDMGFEDASWAYWGIGRHLGDPWPQNAKGHVLGDVRDQGKAPDDPTARGNEIGGAALGFHSDGSDLVGLLCLHPGVSGGESVISNAVAAHNELVRTRPDLAAALYEPLPYDFRGEQRDGGKPFYSVPAFSRKGDRLFVRYIPQFIIASQRHDDAPRLTATQKEAMKAYSALVDDPDFHVEMTFAPGDMQFINNYHVLHGRRTYTDDAASGQVRFLKRLWLATNILPANERPDRFQRTGAMDHWGAKRTRAS